MRLPFAAALALAAALAAASFAQSQPQPPRAPQAPARLMLTPEMQADVQQQSAPRHDGQIVGFVEASLSGTATLREAALPEVQVSIPPINGQPGPGHTIQTNSQGRFRTAILAPGSYSICAARDGFTTSCVKADITDHNVALAEPIEIKPVGSALRGCVTLKGGSPAARNATALQETAGSAEVSALNASGQVVAGPVKVNAAGCYVLPRVPDLKDLRVQAKYELASAQQPVPARALASGAPVNVTLPNAPPSISAFTATFAGQVVTRVPPGSTVRASVRATSPANYPLHYTWVDGIGTALPGDGASQEWRLPGTNSLNLLFVEVSDGHGGVARDMLAVSTGAAPPQARTQPPASPGLRIPHRVPEKKFKDLVSTFIDPSLFMGFCSDSDPASNPQSCAAEATRYYESIGVFDTKGSPSGIYANFGQWKKYWGFTDDPTKPESNLGRSAVYYNNGDLQFGRNMHCLSFGFYGDETTPYSAEEIDTYPAVCYVINYSDATNLPGGNPQTSIQNAESNNAPIAAVAMEAIVTIRYTSGLSQATVTPVVRFIVFTPPKTGPGTFDDFVPNPNAVLDSEGPKAVPGACIACHGGTYDTTKHNFTAAARFLPFDTPNTPFPNFLYDTTNAKFSATSEAEAFRVLNAIVRNASTEGTAQKTSKGTTFDFVITSTAIRDLIDGWYSWCGGVDTTGCRIDDQNHPFIPSGTCSSNSVTCGWNQNPTVYQQFPREVCRTCHVAHADVFDWQNYQRVTQGIASVCSNIKSYFMPFDEVAYDNFWTSTVGSSVFTKFVSPCSLTAPPAQ